MRCLPAWPRSSAGRAVRRAERGLPANAQRERDVMRLFWVVIAVLAAGVGLLVASQDSGTVFGIDSNAFGSALYLGLWAAVLVVALFGSRTRFRDAARDLAYWL